MSAMIEGEVPGYAFSITDTECRLQRSAQADLFRQKS